MTEKHSFDEFTKGVRALRNMSKTLIYADDGNARFERYTGKFLERMGFKHWMEGRK